VFSFPNFRSLNYRLSVDVSFPPLASGALVTLVDPLVKLFQSDPTNPVLFLWSDILARRAAPSSVFGRLRASRFTKRDVAEDLLRPGADDVASLDFLSVVAAAGGSGRAGVSLKILWFWEEYFWWKGEGMLDGFVKMKWWKFSGAAE